MIEHILIAFYAPDPHRGRRPVAAPAARVCRSAHGDVLVRAVLLGRCRQRRCGSVGRFVVNPWTALVAFNVVMVLWHVPALFDTAEKNQVIHIWLMHASFFVTGVLFWLQIIPSYPFRLRGDAALADRRHHLDQRRHVRPGHVAVALHRAPAGTRSTPTSPASRSRPSPTSRSGRPSCGSAATSGPSRPWPWPSAGPSTPRRASRSASTGSSTGPRTPHSRPCGRPDRPPTSGLTG